MMISVVMSIYMLEACQRLQGSGCLIGALRESK